MHEVRVIDGAALARIRFPDSDGRAEDELIQVVPSTPSQPNAFAWQQWGPNDEVLIQQHLTGSPSGTPCGTHLVSSRPVDINGDPGELFICNRGSAVVLWNHDGDQLELMGGRRDPLPPDELVELARRVEFGAR